MTSSFEYVIKASIQDKQERIVAGYATVEVPDRDNEIITVDSVAKAFQKYLDNPVLLLHHDTTKPVGVVKNYDIREKNGTRGVWVEAQIARNTQLADEAWELVKQGVIKAFSLRGRVGNARMTRKAGKQVRVIEVSDLQEISLVSVPANPEALVEVVSKALKQEHYQDNENGSENVTDKGNENEKEIQEQVTKAIESLKTDLTKHIDDIINQKFNPVLETVKALNETIKEIKPPKETQEQPAHDIQKQIQEEVKKAVEENTQILILKKALGVANQDEEKQDEVNVEDGPVDIEKFAKLVKEAKI